CSTSSTPLRLFHRRVVRLLFLKDDERIHRIKHELPLPSLVVFDRREIQSAMDINALERTSGTAQKQRGRKPGRVMSAEARRRIGLAMKKRWAQRKKAAA